MLFHVARESPARRIISARIVISYSCFPLSANPYENTTEEAASEFSNREIPVNPEVDLNLQTSK